MLFKRKPGARTSGQRLAGALDLTPQYLMVHLSPPSSGRQRPKQSARDQRGGSHPAFWELKQQPRVMGHWCQGSDREVKYRAPPTPGSKNSMPKARGGRRQVAVEAHVRALLGRKPGGEVEPSQVGFLQWLIGQVLPNQKLRAPTSAP